MRSGVANHGPKMYTLKDHHEIELNLLFPFIQIINKILYLHLIFIPFIDQRVDYKVLKWLIV